MPPDERGSQQQRADDEQADLQMPGVCSRANLILFLALKFGKQVALNHCLKPQTN